MFEEVLFLFWAFLLLIWIICEYWLKDIVGAPYPTIITTTAATTTMSDSTITSAEAQENRRSGTFMEFYADKRQELSCEESDTELDAMDLRFRLKQMESMIEVLIPYKEKLDSLSSGAESSRALISLCDRLSVLESENRSLQRENGTQRRKYERCLDQVALHVAHILVSQQNLRGKCQHLHKRVLHLEQENHELYKYFRRQIDRINRVNDQGSNSTGGHIYELPDYFGSSEEVPNKKNIDADTGMYDSLETELPSSLPCSLSVSPGDDPRAAAAAAAAAPPGAFGVRSQTIPPYTSPSRSRTALASGNSRRPAAPQTRGVFSSFAADAKGSSAGWNEAGPGRQVVGLLEFEANLFPAERKKANTAAAAVVAAAAGEEEYSTLLPEKKEKSRFCESLDDEIQASFKSEDSRCGGGQGGGGGGGGDRLLRRIGRTETDLLSFKSEENPDFCSVDSDEAQSLIPDSSDRLTRTSSLSLSELLGRTPNLTSDSEGLSIDDYPCLDPNVTRSITEENSYEDSDYEELLAKDASPPGTNDTISAQNLSAQNSLTRARDSRCNRKPSYQAPHYPDHPTKSADNVVCDHFNVLSRCSNKKLKSAADKIFAAKIKVHSTRAADCGVVGRNAGFENCQESRHDDDDDVDNTQLNRQQPSFLKASSDSPRGQKDAAVGTSASGSQDFEQNGRGGVPSKISSPFPVAVANISAPPAHDYYNVARFNFKQRTEPLLARRKLNSPSKSVAPALPTKRSEDLNKVDGAVPRKTAGSLAAGFQSLGGAREYKRSGRRLLLRRRQNKQTAHGGGGAAADSSSDSDDKAHQAALTSSSESDTVTGEKPPSSQDDGYSSNSLPSESSSGRQASAQLGRFGRRRETAWQEASVEIVEIVPIPKNLSFEFISDRRSERKRLQEMRIRRNLEASVDEEDELTDSQTDNYHNDLKTASDSPDQQHLSEKTDHLDKDTLNDNAIPPSESPAPSDDEDK